MSDTPFDPWKSLPEDLDLDPAPGRPRPFRIGDPVTIKLNKDCEYCYSSASRLGLDGLEGIVRTVELSDADRHHIQHHLPDMPVRLYDSAFSHQFWVEVPKALAMIKKKFPHMVQPGKSPIFQFTEDEIVLREEKSP